MRVLLSVALRSVLSTVIRARRGARRRPSPAAAGRSHTLVLKEGAARSATFRALVDRIEASNVIVYIGVSPLLKSTLPGKLTLDDTRRRLPLRARLDQHRAARSIR